MLTTRTGFRRGGLIKATLLTLGGIALVGSLMTAGTQGPSSTDTQKPDGLASSSSLPARTNNTTAPRETRPDVRKKHTRNEFRALVIGRTGDEVLAALGKPKATQRSGDVELWDYPGRTTDPVTGKVDDLAQVEFVDGRVHEVTFTRL